MDAQARLSKNYTKEGGTNAEALPWAAIIQALMSLLGGCPPKEQKAFARAHPVATKWTINRQLKNGDDFRNKRNRDAATEAAYKTFIAMSDDEIADLAAR